MVTSDIGIGIGSDYQRRVDVRYPQLTQRVIQRGQDEGRDVEKQGPGVAVATLA